MIINVGIDYSYTSPCLCIVKGEPLNDLSNVKWYFMNGVKKYNKSFDGGRINGKYLNTKLPTIEKFDLISSHFMGIINEYKEQYKDSEFNIFIESYSYGSKNGKVFEIGENTGILKHKLYLKDIEYNLITPSEIKKLFTGKGNANKDLMYENFFEKTNYDLGGLLCTRNVKDSPVSDIVDSFAIVETIIKMKGITT